VNGAEETPADAELAFASRREEATGTPVESSLGSIGTATTGTEPPGIRMPMLDRDDLLGGG
jgi:hypothetical protein